MPEHIGEHLMKMRQDAEHTVALYAEHAEMVVYRPAEWCICDPSYYRGPRTSTTQWWHEIEQLATPPHLAIAVHAQTRMCLALNDRTHLVAWPRWYSQPWFCEADNELLRVAQDDHPRADWWWTSINAAGLWWITCYLCNSVIFYGDGTETIPGEHYTMLMTHRTKHLAEYVPNHHACPEQTP